MKTFKAIIIDDETSARDIIEGLLNKYYPQTNIIGKYENLEKGVDKIKQEKPDVVFLDIEMPNYAGYEIVSFFEEINFEIIFITAYDNYAIKAFELSAVDYLLKPISIDRFKEAIERLQSKLELAEMKENYDVLKKNLENNAQKMIMVPNHGDQKVLPLNTIVAFEAKEAYTMIHTLEEGKFLMSKNLKHFENLLVDEENFYRSHKSWIIQVALIRKYSKSDHIIELETGLNAKLSKYKKPEFEDKIKL